MSVSREKVDKKVKERGWENVWKHSDYVCQSIGLYFWLEIIRVEKKQIKRKHTQKYKVLDLLDWSYIL